MSFSCKSLKTTILIPFTFVKGISYIGTYELNKVFIRLITLKRGGQGLPFCFLVPYSFSSLKQKKKRNTDRKLMFVLPATKRCGGET